MAKDLKIVTIVGARPQFVKAAALSNTLLDFQNIEEVLVHTGQHYDDNLSDIFFSELKLKKPNYHLGVGSLSHGEQTAKMLSAIEKILIVEKPSCVLVYGDTNSTLAGALAAVKLQIPIVHVESGLRSHELTQPEEVNRILTDRISDMLFTPSFQAQENLRVEAIVLEKIHHVGDIMYDAVNLFSQQINASDIVRKLQLTPNNYFVVTLHRAENTDNPQILKQIIDEINRLSEFYQFVFPLHPRTKCCLDQNDLILNPAITVIEPVGFFDMLQLLKNAKMALTDSGGLQKEAFYFQVPCIILRETTEWVELVASGWNVLLPPRNISQLAAIIQQLSCAKLEWHNPYGDGRTAQKIIASIVAKYTV